MAEIQPAGNSATKQPSERLIASTQTIASSSDPDANHYSHPLSETACKGGQQGKKLERGRSISGPQSMSMLSVLRVSPLANKLVDNPEKNISGWWYAVPVFFLVTAAVAFGVAIGGLGLELSWLAILEALSGSAEVGVCALTYTASVSLLLAVISWGVVFYQRHEKSEAVQKPKTTHLSKYSTDEEKAKAKKNMKSVCETWVSEGNISPASAWIAFRVLSKKAVIEHLAKLDAYIKTSRKTNTENYTKAIVSAINEQLVDNWMLDSLAEIIIEYSGNSWLIFEDILGDGNGKYNTLALLCNNLAWYSSLHLMDSLCNKGKGNAILPFDKNASTILSLAVNVSKYAFEYLSYAYVLKGADSPKKLSSAFNDTYGFLLIVKGEYKSAMIVLKKYYSDYISLEDEQKYPLIELYEAYIHYQAASLLASLSSSFLDTEKTVTITIANFRKRVIFFLHRFQSESSLGLSRNRNRNRTFGDVMNDARHGEDIFESHAKFKTVLFPTNDEQDYFPRARRGKQGEEGAWYEVEFNHLANLGMLVSSRYENAIQAKRDHVAED